MSVNQFGGYVQVKVGQIPKSKLQKALDGQTVRLTRAELSGDRVMLVHPLNAKKIKSAQRTGKGVSTQFAQGEAQADLAYHDHVGAGMHGGSLWSWLKNKAWPFLKNKVWPAIKPVVSELADTAIPAVAASFGVPQAAIPVRALVKETTGVGVGKPKKGSPEMKAKMAALRAKKKDLTGSSFRMP